MKYSLNQNNNQTMLLFLIVLLFFNYNIIKAQSDLENHQKYWYYKSRLYNDFMKVGLNPGESIPSQRRGKENPFLNFSDDVNCKMDWGDASSYLGFYIGTLAMEYYLLKQNNQSVDKVSYEIFCALNAINRLDYYGETFFDGQPTLNGYFVRDDVDANFVNNNYNHFNYYSNGNSLNSNSPGKGFMSDFTAGANKVNSSKEGWLNWRLTHDYLSDHDGPIPEMSQDQAYSLFVGLALVKKFVDNNANYNYTPFPYCSYSNVYFTTEADNITDRIINHMRYSQNLNGGTCSTVPSYGWKIKNPVTCNPVGFNHANGNMGDNLTWSSYAVAEAGCVIRGNNWGGSGQFNLGFYPRACPLSSSYNYHNTHSITDGVTQWETMTGSLLPGNGDNRLHVAQLQAVCNCDYASGPDVVVNTVVNALQQVPVLGWLGVVIGWVWNIVSSIVYTVIPGAYYNDTSTSILVNSYPTLPFKSDIDHAPLLRKVLYGGVYVPNTKYSFDYLLDVMPCDNVYYLPNESTPYTQIEWSGSDRLEHSRQRIPPAGDGGGEPNPLLRQTGEFPALDYLFYHNLYYIHQIQKGNGTNMEDLSHIYVNKNGGNAPQNTIYRGYETIKTENTIFQPVSNLGYFLAGKSISFGPGTEIKTGATNGGVHAYVQPNTCATDNGSFYRTNSSAFQPTIDTQPHFVNYPAETKITSTATNEVKTNLIDELPITKEQQFENAMIKAYPEYSKEFFVKPTITKEKVHIYFTLTDNEYACINVYTLSGQLVFSDNYLGKERSGAAIDLSNLPSSIYLIKFTTTSGVSRTQKIVKE
ncbi:MAG: T9SS type A sorting domain-containing protein [Bacteroidetes bacterium]|nr:T9SS type A sorting domain-containing protein [Bacteroidota bacterium]